MEREERRLRPQARAEEHREATRAIPKTAPIASAVYTFVLDAPTTIMSGIAAVIT